MLVIVGVLFLRNAPSDSVTRWSGIAGIVGGGVGLVQAVIKIIGLLRTPPPDDAVVFTYLKRRIGDVRRDERAKLVPADAAADIEVDIHPAIELGWTRNDAGT